MHIPQSTIEPFGYTGIPVLTNPTVITKHTVMTAIDNYRKNVDGVDVIMRDEVIIRDVERFARHVGAIDPKCTHRWNLEKYRVFQVVFSIDNTTGHFSYCFGFQYK